jgi:hypothetical protein
MTVDEIASEEAAVASPARWMRRVLLAAAAYNVAWGLFAIVSPLAVFRWCGFDPLPAYPEIWQCLGMVIGVYGIGYGIAAFDPYRHWAIVFVGLLGKLFGPIGFVASATSGRLPWSFGAMLLFNDLIWLAPFTLILWRTARAANLGSQVMTVAAPPRPSDPLRQMLSQYGSSLDELSRRQPVLLVLLRHSGCTFCREALSDVAQAREQVEKAGTRIALVHQGSDEPIDLLARHGLTDLHRFRDPYRRLYEHFGLPQGRVGQLFGPAIWWRGFKAYLAGHRLGPRDGDSFRMPGTFLLHRGRVVREFRNANAAERPDYAALAILPGESEGRDRVVADAART